jgi:hypothetical protein
MSDINDFGRARNPLYVFVPQRLVLTPPIAHRGSNASARVSPFEFAVLAGVLIEARAAVGNAHHTQAYQAAKSTIVQERELHQNFREKWRSVKKRRRLGEQVEAPVRRHTFPVHFVNDHDYNPHKPMKLKRALKRAGRYKYQDELRRLRRHHAPDDVVLTVSRYALLRSAGLANNGNNLRKLDQALDRLCRAVGGGEPPLVSWQVDAGKLELHVSGEWLRPPYVALPMPLPRNATTLALTLFVQGIRTERSYKKAISLAALCDRLGVPSWGPTAANRSINAALDSLNELLAKLDRAALSKYKVYPLASYDIEEVGNGGVRIVGNLDNTDYDELSVEDLVEEQMSQKKKKILVKGRSQRMRLKRPSRDTHSEATKRVDLTELRLARTMPSDPAPQLSERMQHNDGVAWLEVRLDRMIARNPAYSQLVTTHRG